jgi:enediyne biosynthesis protein E4
MKNISWIKKIIFIVFLIGVSLFSCKKGGSNTQADVGPQRFEKLSSDKTGIHFINKIKEDFNFNFFKNLNLYNGGGVGIIDINNDGLQDVFFTSTDGSCKLYMNEGGLKFKDITDAAGVAAPEGVKTGVTIVDINNDGYQDIYVCKMGSGNPEARRNILFVNNKNNTFTEKAKEYGIDDASASNHATFFDYDKDGDLDLFIINFPENFEFTSKIMGKQKLDGSYDIDRAPKSPYDSDRLYKNNGNGTYSDATEGSGLVRRDFSLSTQIHDFNNDGWPDIYVANDFIDQDDIYINNHNGTFTERSFDYFKHTTNHTMGTALEDINNDGLLDLMQLDMMGNDNFRQKQMKTTMEKARYNILVKIGYGNQVMRNTLQLNNGNGTFSDVGCMAGINFTDWSWSCLVQDFDNDGYKDAYITNGYYRDVSDMDYVTFTVDSVNQAGGVNPGRFPKFDDFAKLIPSNKIQNFMYKNNGDLSFSEATNQWGFEGKSNSNGSAFVDLDNDGDLDIIVSNLTDEAFVYKNKSDEIKDNNYLQIKLKGPEKNTDGLQASVRIRYDKDKVQYAEMLPNKGFYSSSERLFHFGIGKTASIDEVALLWPDGKVQIMTNVKPNQRLVLNYKDATVGTIPAINSSSNPFFAENTGQNGLDFTHKENEFIDFDREFLLPHKLSNQGPCIATGDVNGDGLEDVYIGGARESIGRLFLQVADGKFVNSGSKAFDNDEKYEDTGATFFDADGDKDFDLYIVSGGNEAGYADQSYQDRMYINDGKGNFARNNDAIPQETEAGSKVVAWDYDKDGDMDLLVGGSNIPNSYPLAPNSFLLINDKGTFSDGTSNIAPDFQKLGMITDLVTGDIDKDGSAELIVTAEWQPISVFKFDGSQLKNITSKTGLGDTNGWWNTATLADLDNDGNLDIIAGNLGLNTRLRASASEPLSIYAKDFDGNGSLDALLSYYNQGIEHPLLQRDLVLKQIPSLKKKFVRYGTYSSATMTDVYDKSTLKEGTVLKAYTFNTTWYKNDGKGNFTAMKLPYIAQMSPTKSIVVQDINNDKNLDILLVGNDYGLEVETNKCDAGNGVVLLGDGKGDFQYVSNRQSGLWANKEAREIKKIKASNGKTTFLVANNNDKVQSFVMR